AVPLLFVFTALFTSADATFERYVGTLGDLLVADLPRHAAVALGLAWLAGGLLSAVAAGVAANPLHRLPLPRVGAEECQVVMGLLAALFCSFVVLQLGYLFGGRELID